MDHRLPSLLPEGHHVLFTVQHASLRADRSVVAVLSLDTARWTPIVTGGVCYISAGHIVFRRDRTLLAVPFALSADREQG